MTTLVAQLQQVQLSYGTTKALDSISLDIPAGVMVGLIGPDGVGKSSLLALLSGARAIQQGKVQVLVVIWQAASIAMQCAPILLICRRGWGRIFI